MALQFVILIAVARVFSLELTLCYQHNGKTLVFGGLAVVSEKEPFGTGFGSVGGVSCLGVINQQVPCSGRRNQVVKSLGGSDFGFVRPKIDGGHQSAGHDCPLMGRIQGGKEPDGCVFAFSFVVVQVCAITSDNAALANSQNHKSVLQLVRERNFLAFVQVFQKRCQDIAVLLERPGHGVGKLHEYGSVTEGFKHFGNAEFLCFVLQLRQGPYFVCTQVYPVYDKERFLQIEPEARFRQKRRIDDS